ncbi:type I DNA topoisomerase [Gayadomonas joobiniege]|uniref:DNA topoisomerase family protein n=1 Tax=Gayadomonas joobiniege TaxID=1234606 RepID=UPI0003787287|nr:type I DNA topoisomerase [Gayadomonas joobiniege]
MSSDAQLFDSIEEKPKCPECQRLLVFRNGKAGPFLGCSGYPECRYIKPLHAEHDSSLDKVIDGSECPQCSAPLSVKHGRFGIFIGCSQFPICHYTEQKEQVEEATTEVQCPQCKKGKLQRKQNRFGKYFYPCERYPGCKYAVNNPPLAVTCELCQWPVMVERNSKTGLYLQCPQKKCQHKQQKL